ncbi:GntR family transcriptional regulator [Tessaracoccus terricola]
MSTTPAGGLADQAYELLLERIQSCAYLPGQTISEQGISDETGIGRTPVREALQRLRRERLVVVYPRKGMQVAAFSEQSVTELYQTRRLLEPAVLTQYISTYPKRELFDLRRRFEELGDGETEAHYHLDVEFHCFLVAVVDNSILTSLHQGLMRQQFRLAMYAASLGTSDPKHNLPEHLAIIDATLRENATAATDALIYHLNHSLAASLRSLEYVRRNPNLADPPGKN